MIGCEYLVFLCSRAVTLRHRERPKNIPRAKPRSRKERLLFTIEPQRSQSEGLFHELREANHDMNALGGGGFVVVVPLAAVCRSLLVLAQGRSVAGGRKGRKTILARSRKGKN